MKTLAVSLLLAASSAAFCAACESHAPDDTPVQVRIAAFHAAPADKDTKTRAPAPKSPAPAQPKSPAPAERKPGPPPVLFM